MLRQKRTLGSIIEIKINDQFYVYGQILDKASYAFFDYKSIDKVIDFRILEDCKVLFILAVYKDIITDGHWVKVGKLPIRKEFETLPMQFVQDTINEKVFSLYNPNTGEMKPAKKEECKGLEIAAVYDAEHVELRLKDHFSGRINLERQSELDLFN